MRIAIVLVLSLAWAGPSTAQPLRSEGGELFVSVGSAHIFRVEDRTFGDRPDIGGGVRLPVTRHIGVEFHINRALGLRAEPARCGIPAGCIGVAREGVLAATLATANVVVRFPHDRVEPFIVGGAGGLWTRTVNSVTMVRDGIGLMSEFESRDAGLAIAVGAGVDVSLTPRVSLRPEIRLYDSSAMSRTNLAVIRPSLSVGWRW